MVGEKRVACRSNGRGSRRAVLEKRQNTVGGYRRTAGVAAVVEGDGTAAGNARRAGAASVVEAEFSVDLQACAAAVDNYAGAGEAQHRDVIHGNVVCRRP